MKKNLLTWIVIMITISISFAQQNDCTRAQDSAKARLGRKELSFYTYAKGPQKVMYFHRIDGKHYERTLLKKMGKDTSVQYMTCYNTAYQSALDSVFKCDFFRKTDSIMTYYDDNGMGYRAAEFPGGQDSLNLWLSKNVKLPQGAAPDDSDANIRVYYFIHIDPSGNINQVQFAKTNCKICEPAVTEALKKLPKFVPSTQAGVATKSTYILPYSHKVK